MGKMTQKSIGRGYWGGAWLLLLLLAACGGGGGPSFGPEVVKTDPGNEAGNVPVNAPIRATFSYDIDPVTVNKETFIVSGVDGAVSYQDQTAVFTPSPETPLEEGKKYYAILTTGIKDLDGISLPSNFTWSFETSGLPSIETVDPKENATEAPVETPITVLFSKSMDAATLNAQTFFIKKEGSSSAIAAAIAYRDETRTATLDPTLPLAFSSKYVVGVTTGAKDRSGNSLATAKAWTFTTAGAPDTKPPEIKVKSPEANATSISTNTGVSVTFDAPIDPTNLESKFFLRDSISVVATTLTVSMPTLTLKPLADLDFGIKYEVVLTGIKDLSGNKIPSDLVWSFTTGRAPDHVPPTVVERNPDEGAEGVPVVAKISVRFSEPMDAGSITPRDNFTLFRIGTNKLEKVNGTATYDSATLTASFTPSERLHDLSTYQIFLRQLKDASGNSLNVAPWTFVTVEAPKVESTSPQSFETNVPTAASITVRFSRAIRQESVNADSFKIEGRPGGVFTFPDGQTATLTPDGPLAEGTTYQVTLTPAIEDAQGNPLEFPYVWFFMTASPVESAPEVVATEPPHGATGISVQMAQVSASFNRPIDPASLLGRFLVFDSVGRPVSGSVDRSAGAQAVFSFMTPLLYNTWYGATLAAGIQSDSHASSTSEPYDWCFKTEPDPMITPPPETAPPEGCVRPGP